MHRTWETLGLHCSTSRSTLQHLSAPNPRFTRSLLAQDYVKSESEVEPAAQLWKAICLYALGDYKEAEQCALKGPSSQLGPLSQVLSPPHISPPNHTFNPFIVQTTSASDFPARSSAPPPPCRHSQRRRPCTTSATLPRTTSATLPRTTAANAHSTRQNSLPRHRHHARLSQPSTKLSSLPIPRPARRSRPPQRQNRIPPRIPHRCCQTQSKQEEYCENEPAAHSSCRSCRTASCSTSRTSCWTRPSS